MRRFRGWRRLLAAVTALLCLALPGCRKPAGAAGGVTVRVAGRGDRAESRQLFAEKPAAYAPLEAEAGRTYTFEMANNGEHAAVVELLFHAAGGGSATGETDEASRTVTLEPHAAQVLEWTCVEDGVVHLGVTVCAAPRIVYVSDAATLIRAAGDEANRGGELRLLCDIAAPPAEGLFTLSVPCTLDLAGRRLSLDGGLLLAAAEAGIFTLRSGPGGRLDAEALYADAPACAVVTEGVFPGLSDGEAAYFLRAASYNGKSLDGVPIPVTSADRFAQLADDRRYPRLWDGAVLLFETDITLDYTEKAAPVLSKAVSFDIRAALTIQGGALTVRSAAEREVQVAIGGQGRLTGALRYDTPYAALRWSGKGAPEPAAAAEQMNVRTYNDQAMASYGLGGPGQAMLTAFQLTKAKNAGLLADVTYRIDGNLVTAEVPDHVGDSELRRAVPQTTAAGRVTFPAASNSRVDLTKETRCVVTDAAGQTRTYTVRTTRPETAIPRLWLTTAGGAAVTSKDTYIGATLRVEGGSAGLTASVQGLSLRMRGRGNSTWDWPKKPYKLKFDEKVTFFGLPKAKDWALLANYADKSLMRNHVADEMGKALDGLVYTPSQYPVKVYLNGAYQGVYSLGEHMEAAKGRVDIGEDQSGVDAGYLLEVGGAVKRDIQQGMAFHAGSLRFVRIQEPDPADLSAEQIAYIRDYMTAADAAVKALHGYEEYLDIPSLIDWLLLHELTYNLDSGFHRSCYFTKKPGEKLHMGPIWDFDLAFGNFSKDNPRYDDWATGNNAYVGQTWTSNLLRDPVFTAQLKARWKTAGPRLRQAADQAITNASAWLADAQQSNFLRWNILGRKVAYEPARCSRYDTFAKQVTYLRRFLTDRYAWLDQAIGKLP